MNDADIEAQKSVEFYSASVNAWYTSALEHDKSIFALAGGGIAILITLLTTVGFEDWTTLSLFIVAIGSFLVTIAALLLVFRRNQAYIESTLKKGEPHTDLSLQRLDRTAQLAFAVGVVFASAVGISAAITSFQNKRTEREKLMTTDNKSSQGQSGRTLDSVNGSARLQPDFTKSFHGAGNLAPAASAPASTPVASAATTAATPAAAPP